jgi:hypothetical protein
MNKNAVIRKAAGTRAGEEVAENLLYYKELT